MFRLMMLLIFFECFSITTVMAALQPPHQPLFNRQTPTSTKPPSPSSSQPQQTPIEHLPSKKLPIMSKPFEMPGVIGFQNGNWQGRDYLGYVSNNIGIDVEVLAGDRANEVPNSPTLEARVSKIFENEQIIPHAEITEGPPLPFFHLLILAYPIENDRYVIFGAGRLFEQVQVMRKRFIPSGYWQAITWEDQDVLSANASNLNDQINALVDKLATAFVKRYRAYNSNENALPSQETKAGE